MGVPVLAVDHRPSALGFRSRHAMPVASPDPGTDAGGLRRPAPRLRRRARPPDTDPPHARSAGERDRPPPRRARRALPLSVSRPGHARPRPEQSGSSSSEPQRPASISPTTAHPRSAEEALAAADAHRLPAARQTVEPGRLQAPLPTPGLPVRDARGARARVRRRGAVRADGAGAHSRAETTSSTPSAATSPPTGRYWACSAAASFASRRPASGRVGLARPSGYKMPSTPPCACSGHSTSTACRRWSSSAIRATAGSSSWR